MVEEIETAIHEVTDEITSQVPVSPQKGSDLYLEEGYEQKKLYDGIVIKLRQLNEDTIKAFNENQDEGYTLLGSMRTLLDACNRRLTILNKSYYADVMRSTIDDLEEETDMLAENIEDFVHIHDEIPNNKELQSLLSQI